MVPAETSAASTKVLQAKDKHSGFLNFLKTSGNSKIIMITLFSMLGADTYAVCL